MNPIVTIKKKHRLLPVLLFLSLLTACTSSEPKLWESRGKTMGTTWLVKFTAGPTVDVDAISEGVQQQLDRVNNLMSTWVEDSDISRFNRYRGQDSMEIDPHTVRVIQNAIDIAQKTDGALDPTLSPLIEIWGFGKKERDPEFPSDELIADTLAKVGLQHLQLSGTRLGKAVPELTLNLGANAKGYGVDVVATFLESKGIDQYMVEVGGEVRTAAPASRKNPWRIGISDPDNAATGGLIRIAQLRNHALATSGDYRLFFEKDGVRYSHILDPKTGRPIPERITSVSVIAPDCMTADALATALMVLDPDQALTIVESMPEVECLIFVRENGQITEHPSTGMKAFLAE